MSSSVGQAQLSFDGILSAYVIRNEAELSRLAEAIRHKDEKSLLDHISQLRESVQLLAQYLSALLAISYRRSMIPSQIDSNEEKLFTKSFFPRIFLYCIEELKRGSLDSDKSVLDALFLHSSYLPEDVASKMAHKIIDKFCPDTPSSVQGHCAALDLLSQLSDRGGPSCRSSIVDKLCSITWQANIAVILASTLVECCSNSIEFSSTASKIEEVLTASISYTCGSRDDVDVCEDECLEVEELPQMLYQLTIIGNKMEVLGEISPEMTKQILHCITFCVDSLLSVFLESANSFRVRIENICLTICHHLSLSVSKDKTLCRQILKDFKSRKISTRSPFLINYVGSKYSDKVAGGKITSPAMLMFAFLVAKSQRQEDKISGVLLEVIDDIYSMNERAESSLFYQDNMWKGDVVFSSDSFKVAFELMFSSPLMFEPIIRPLLSFAFTLIDAVKPRTRHSWESLTNSSLYCISRALVSDRSCSVAIFGTWITSHLFSLCSHSRSQVIREIISRLAAASVDVPNVNCFGRTTSKHLVAEMCVDILKDICISCQQGVFEVGNDLQEVFLYLTDFSPHLTKTLLSALYPFFLLLPGLGDRCSISLRKASFSKDASCRQAAVSSIISLLSSHLKTTLNSSSSSSSVIASNSRYQESLMFQQKFKQKVATGLSVEEIMVLLKRFLQHQSSVRSIVYKDLYQISLEHPAFRPVCLRLLRGHFMTLLQSSVSDHEAFSRSSGVTSEVFGDNIVINLDKFVDEAGNLLENIKDLILVMLSITILSASSDTFVADIFSQSDRLHAISEGDSMTFTQTICITNEKEAEIAALAIWSFCLFLSQADLDDIFSSSPTNSLDISKLEVLFSAYYASTIAITLLPDTYLPSNHDSRYDVLKQLTKRMVIILSVVNKYKKLTKDKEAKANKEKLKALENSVSSELILRGHFSEDRKVSCYPEIDIECEYQLLSEIQFVSKIMEQVVGANAEGHFPSQGYSEPFLSGFFPGMILERSVVCLEKLIVFVSRVVNFGVGYIENLRTSLKQLFPYLTRFLGILRLSEDGSQEERLKYPLVFLSTTALNNASSLQLVFRSMLGCIKVILASYQNSSVSMLSDICDLLDTSHFLNTTSNDERNVEQSTKRNLAADVDIIRKFTMHFVSLLVELESSNNSKEKLDSPAVVAIIGELVSTFSSFEKSLSEFGVQDPRKEITESILKACDDNLVEPSLTLSRSLTELILMRCPVSAVDRLNRASYISQLLHRCAQDKEDRIREVIDSAGSQDIVDICASMGNETYTILSTNTLSEVTCSFFGIIESCLTETLALIKVQIKRISSLEDENDDHYVSPISKAPIYMVVKRLVDMVTPLVKPSIGEQGLAKVLHYCLKLYKIEVLLIKEIISSRLSSLPPLFLLMLTETAESLSSNIQEYLSANDKLQQSVSTKRKRGDRGKQSTDKLGKVIPSLIYEMEQFDLQLIKLVSVVTVDKAQISKLVKRSQVRDFRLKI